MLEARKKEKGKRKKEKGFFSVVLVCVTGVLLLGAMVGSSGCGKTTETAKDKFYDIKGTVLALEPAEKKIRLDHEEIPGWMPAMKMRIDVKDVKLLEGLQVGDKVEGRILRKADESFFITELKKRG